MLKETNYNVTKVLLLDIDEELLIKRITGRLVHVKSGRSYHEQFNPPINYMKDDITGEELIRRADDNKETLTRRLNAFHQRTAPLIDFYKQQGILSVVNASGDVEQVWKSILEELKHNEK